MGITFMPLISIPIRRCSVSLNCHLAIIIQWQWITLASEDSVDTLVTCLSSGQHRQEKVNLEKLDSSCGHRGASWVHGCRTPVTAGLTVTKTCQVSFPFPNNHKHLFNCRLSVGIKQPREAERKISVDAQGFLPQDKHLGSWEFFFFFLVLVLALHRPRR